jgi:hypothetical protein
MSRRDVENVRKLVAASAKLDSSGQRAMRRLGDEAVAAASAITKASLVDGGRGGHSDRDVRYAVGRYDAAYSAAEQIAPDGFFPESSRELILMAASEAPRVLAGLGTPGVSASDGGGRQLGSRGGPALEL